MGRTTAARSTVAQLAAVARGVMVPTKVDKLDLREVGDSWEKRHEIGRQLRAQTPREAHAEWSPPKGRPDPISIVLRTNEGRQAELVPLRMGRMAASPFAFLRGAAAVMACDLAQGPSSGLHVVIDGDAHCTNFGLFGTPEHDVVFDLNDFDEATIGPWGWDLKRLVASINVAGRENGLNRRKRHRAVMECARGYRWNMGRLQSISVTDMWSLDTVADRIDPKVVKVPVKTEAILQKAVAKARGQTNATLLAKVAERTSNGAWRLKEDPPIMTPVAAETRERVVDALHAYGDTLPHHRRYMLNRYHVVDVANRVVGVGSVGTRAYLVLLLGNSDNDPLFLQVKEATVPAHAPYVPPLPEGYSHQGKRVVHGQHLLQAVGDPLLGWTQIDGRPFYVRQMKNMKGSIPTQWLSGEPVNFASWAYGALLARAHARTGDAAVVAGYLGNSDVYDSAIADWAEAYGDQTERDHAALVRAIKSGRVKAIQGV
jgi:uncharacterized protein (DUF2252 family)